MHETDTAFGDLVEMGCFVKRLIIVKIAIVTGDILPTEVIDQEVDDIGLGIAFHN